jgi:hypothetical protein
MATYNTAFGSLPGTNEMLGTTNTTGGGRQQVYDPQAQQKKQRQAQAQTSQTFAQLQQQGMARPAPQAPQVKPAQQYAGSQQGQQMRQQLQQQLQSFGAAPSRFDTQAFQQIRGAQAQNLQAEYQGQQKALNEDLARRGLFASSIGGGRLGDLAGQQARALAGLDAELLGRAADTQAADRAQLLSAGQGLAELAGSQDLQQFEANRVGQATEFEQGLRSAEFGQQQYQQGSDIALRAGQAAQDYEKFSRDQELREAELLGEVGGRGTLAARQQGEQSRQFDLEQSLRQQLGLGGLDVQRGELGLRQQTLQQQAADAAAERSLRESLQTRELSAAERQQLTDITSRRELQTQQLGFQGEESAQERAFRERLQTQQQSEQSRQFDLEQGLRQQLGLGNLTLEQQRAAAQQSQFGESLGEQRAARQQQLGISQQEIGLRAQELQQQAALQGRSLNIQEANNEASNTIERERIAQQATQFGLTLNEQQTDRAQKFGLSTQELALRTRDVEQNFALQGQRLTMDQAQNLALNGLEREKINQQASQFGLRLNEDRTARAEQLGISMQQVNQEAQRIANQNAQFGRQMTATELQNAAQNNLEQARINEVINARTTGVSESALERGLRERLQQNQFGQERGESALERQLRQTLQSNDINLQRERLGQDKSESALERSLRETLQSRDINFQRERMVLDRIIADAIAGGKLQPNFNPVINNPGGGSSGRGGSGGGVGGGGGGGVGDGGIRGGDGGGGYFDGPRLSRGVPQEEILYGGNFIG